MSSRRVSTEVVNFQAACGDEILYTGIVDLHKQQLSRLLKAPKEISAEEDSLRNYQELKRLLGGEGKTLVFGGIVNDEGAPIGLDRNIRTIHQLGNTALFVASREHTFAMHYNKLLKEKFKNQEMLDAYLMYDRVKVLLRLEKSKKNIRRGPQGVNEEIADPIVRIMQSTARALEPAPVTAPTPTPAPAPAPTPTQKPAQKPTPAQKPVGAAARAPARAQKPAAAPEASVAIPTWSIPVTNDTRAGEPYGEITVPAPFIYPPSPPPTESENTDTTETTNTVSEPENTMDAAETTNDVSEPEPEVEPENMTGATEQTDADGSHVQESTFNLRRTLALISVMCLVVVLTLFLNVGGSLVQAKTLVSRHVYGVPEGPWDGIIARLVNTTKKYNGKTLREASADYLADPTTDTLENVLCPAIQYSFASLVVEKYGMDASGWDFRINIPDPFDQLRFINDASACWGMVKICEDPSSFNSTFYEEAFIKAGIRVYAEDIRTDTDSLMRFQETFRELEKIDAEVIQPSVGPSERITEIPEELYQGYDALKEAVQELKRYEFETPDNLDTNIRNIVLSANVTKAPGKEPILSKAGFTFRKTQEMDRVVEEMNAWRDKKVAVIEEEINFLNGLLNKTENFYNASATAHAVLDELKNQTNSTELQMVFDQTLTKVVEPRQQQAYFLLYHLLRKPINDSDDFRIMSQDNWPYGLYVSILNAYEGTYMSRENERKLKRDLLPKIQELKKRIEHLATLFGVNPEEPKHLSSSFGNQSSLQKAFPFMFLVMVLAGTADAATRCETFKKNFWDNMANTCVMPFSQIGEGLQAPIGSIAEEWDQWIFNGPPHRMYSALIFSTVLQVLVSNTVLYLGKTRSTIHDRSDILWYVSCFAFNFFAFEHVLGWGVPSLENMTAVAIEIITGYLFMIGRPELFWVASAASAGLIGAGSLLDIVEIADWAGTPGRFIFNKIIHQLTPEYTFGQILSGFPRYALSPLIALSICSMAGRLVIAGLFGRSAGEQPSPVDQVSVQLSNGLIIRAGSVEMLKQLTGAFQSLFPTPQPQPPTVAPQPQPPTVAPQPHPPTVAPQPQPAYRVGSPEYYAAIQKLRFKADYEAFCEAQRIDLPVGGTTVKNMKTLIRAREIQLLAHNP